MKKNYQNILIIFIASIFIMIPTMNKAYYKGHDTNFHVANISALTSQISWNNIFAKEPLRFIANDFGYGTRIFYPPLPHLTAAYVTKGLSLFSMNDVTIGMRITEWLTFFLSGITFYFLAKKIFKNKKIALLSSCLYMTSPYHLTEVFIRDAFSEMFIPISLPLILLGLLELTEKNYFKFFTLFITGYTLAIYSHLAMSIYLTIIILLTFFPIFWKKIFTKKHILYLSISSLIILSLTSPFWICLLEHKVNGSYAIFMPYYITAKGDLRFSAIHLTDYLNFFLPHTYDFNRYHMHLTVTILILISFILFIKNKIWKQKELLLILLIFIVSLIMTTPLFPWYYTPDILQTLQFPWRLCLYVAFGGILFAMLPLKKLETKKYFSSIIIIGILISLIGSYHYTYHVSEETVDLNNINFNLGMGNQEEYLPEKIIKNYEYYQKRENEIIILNGKAKINILENIVPTLTFNVEETENLIIELPRIYYQGYILEHENEKIEVEESENGFVKVKIENAGTYSLKYVGTKNERIARIVAFLTLIICFVYLIQNKRKRHA